jgi:flagellar motility protein MotE (MotC chaperone)
MTNPSLNNLAVAKSSHCIDKRKLCLAMLTSYLMIFQLIGSDASETNNTSSETPKEAVPLTPPLPTDDYCANIADLAADTRYALQMKTLEILQKQIDKKIILLEAKRAESEEFLKKKDEAIKGTQKGLIDIFAKMKPDVAAAQFEILDVETSASILKQLNARVASTILNEMKTPIAAAITIKMAEPVSEAKPGSGT